MKQEIKDAIAKLAEVTLAQPQGWEGLIVRGGIPGNWIDFEFDTKHGPGMCIYVDGHAREYPNTASEGVERFAALVDEAT